MTKVAQRLQKVSQKRSNGSKASQKGSKKTNWLAFVENFAVFSEIYYEDGWNVSIDGVAVNHINVNYVLRGLEIPKGTHQVVFEFSPSVIKTGSTIALTSTIILLFLILGQMVLIYRTRS